MPSPSFASVQYCTDPNAENHHRPERRDDLASARAEIDARCKNITACERPVRDANVALAVSSYRPGFNDRFLIRPLNRKSLPPAMSCRTNDPTSFHRPRDALRLTANVVLLAIVSEYLTSAPPWLVI